MCSCTVSCIQTDRNHLRLTSKGNTSTHLAQGNGLWSGVPDDALNNRNTTRITVKMILSLGIIGLSSESAVWVGRVSSFLMQLRTVNCGEELKRSNGPFIYDETMRCSYSWKGKGHTNCPSFCNSVPVLCCATSALHLLCLHGLAMKTKANTGLPAQGQLWFGWRRKTFRISHSLFYSSPPQVKTEQKQS